MVHKRTRKQVVDPLAHALTYNSIRRLARRGGVKRMSKARVPVTIRVIAESFLKKVVADAIEYMRHAKRKTITTEDVVHALALNGRTFYGA